MPPTELAPLRDDLCLALVVPHAWERVESVRRATEFAVRAVCAQSSGDFAESLSIAAAELVENALKYGDAGTAVEFRIYKEAGSVAVAVTNAGTTAADERERLAARIEWLGSFASALDAYHAALTTLDTGEGARGGGLGLARVLFEGGCRLHLLPAPGGGVTVEARRDWPLDED